MTPEYFSIDPILLEMFSRQILMREIGLEGLEKLRKSRVFVAGGGALGSASAIFMSRLGVGFIRIVDPDVVELSNLPRTLAYKYEDVLRNTPKAYAVARSIKEISPFTEVDYKIDVIETDNVLDFIKDVDLVLDGLDNLRSRFILNEAAVQLRKPYIYGGVEESYGVVMPIIPGETACLRCLYSSVDIEKIDEERRVIPVSVLTPVAVAFVMTSLALRILLERKIEKKIYYIDVSRPEIKTFDIERNPQCPVCVKGLREFIGVRSVSRIRAVSGAKDLYMIILSKKFDDKDLDKIRSLGSVEKTEFEYKIETEKVFIRLLRGSRIGFVRSRDIDSVRNIYEKITRYLEDDKDTSGGIRDQQK
jgi:adenylyltransferase/sulfurtransferase